jgi:hypothetical protein
MIARIAALLALFVTLLAACAPASSSTSPQPTPPPAPTEMPTPSSPTPQPEGMELYTADDFTMLLPEGWEPVTLSGRDRAAVIEEVERQFPQMGEMVDLDTMFDKMYMTAFNTRNENPLMVDNMNIQLIPSDGLTDLALRLSVDEIERAMQMPNLSVRETDNSLEINGLAAIYLSFEMQFESPAGEPLNSIGHQYYILDDDTLWILTYTLDGAQNEQLKPLVDQSARSFLPAQP